MLDYSGEARRFDGFVGLIKIPSMLASTCTVVAKIEAESKRN